MKNTLFLTLILFILPFDSIAKTITTLDSADIISPKVYTNILSDSIEFEIAPKCSVSKVILYIKTSLKNCDTLCILSSAPYKAIWKTDNLKQNDQMRIQFQYALIHTKGDTIISAATPHRWLKFTHKESGDRKCISRVLNPEEKITIDGNLEEWKKTPANIISSNSYFKTRWSSSDFYFAVTVEDEKITPQDQVEISLDLKPDESPFFGMNQRIFIYGPSRRSFVIAVDKNEKGPMQSDSVIIRVGEEMEWRSKIENQKYSIEIRIPFVLLSDLEFPPATFGFDITVIDNNGKDEDINSWSAKNPNTRQIKLNWGAIELKQNFFPLKLTLLIGLFTFIILIIISSVIGVINKQLTKHKVKGMALSEITQKIVKAAEEHFDNPRLTINDFAKKIETSSNSINEYLDKDLNKNFDSLLTTIRVDKSKSLLLNSDDDIESISKKCGFKNSSEFEEAFLNQMKSDPQDWREGRIDEDEEDERSENSAN